MMVSNKFSVASTSALLLVLVFLSSMAKSDNGMPLTNFPPFSDNLCDQVNCGKGNCSVDSAKPFNFVCTCEPGWKRTRSNDDDLEDDHQFLPCVIPNCSLDYSCMPAPPPSPPVPDNISIFDPCYWTYCGEGTCNKNQTFKHTCDCNPGYTNLMNISHFPCFSSCAIGTDCSRLGVRVLEASSPPGESNQGSRYLSGGVYWIGIIVMSVAMGVWK